MADQRAGYDVFNRFKAGKSGTLWYYSELAKIFDDRMGADAPVVRELAAAVAAMRS